MAAAVGIGRFVYTPILPEMMAAGGWSGSTAGLVASANYLGYLAGAVATAAGCFSKDLRHWLLVALVVSATTTAAMAATDMPGVAAVIRFISGCASALVFVCCSTLVLQRLEAIGDSRLSAIHFAGIGAGILVSAVVVSLIAQWHGSWRTMWLASAAVAFIVVPLAGWLIPPSLVPASPSVAPGDSVRESDSRQRINTPLMLLTIAYGLFGFGYVITATFIVTIVRNDAGISGLEPWIWGVVGVAAMPSIALWTGLAKRIGVLPAYAAASFILGLGVMASVEWPSALGLLIAAAILGSALMGLTSLAFMAARQMVSGSPQRPIGLLTASFAVGQTLGPAVAGYMVDQLGSFRAPSLIAAGLLAFAALLALAAARLMRKKPEERMLPR